MKCPVCRATYPPNGGDRNVTLESESNYSPALGSEAQPPLSSPLLIPTLPAQLPSPERLCRRCGADLSVLIQIHDQAIWYHRQALQLLAGGYVAAAQEKNDQALALHHRQAAFHALAGQLWALQGRFPEAIASWQRAKQLDPEMAIAQDSLHLLAELFETVKADRID